MFFLDVTGTSLYMKNGHIYGLFVDAITLPFKNVTRIDSYFLTKNLICYRVKWKYVSYPVKYISV